MKKLFPLLFFVIIILVLFYRIFFLGEVMYYGDNFQVNAPIKTLLLESVKNREFPLWDPYMYLGMPYFADLNLGTLYPLNILYFISSPVFRSVSIQVAVDIFLLLSFTFFFLRSKRISILSSIFGSIVFSLCGSVFLLINNVAIINSVVYIPLLFLLVTKFIDTKKKSYLFFLIGTQAIQIVSGHPQITYYSFVFVSIFIIFSKFPSQKKIVALLLYWIVPFFLSAVQLLPFLELITNSNRIFQLNPHMGSYSVLNMATALFPTIFGSIVGGNWWGAQYILTGYLGIPTIILLLFGAKKAIRKIKFYLLLALVTFALSFGFPVVDFLIPGMFLFRDAVLILVFTSFFISIAVALSLDKLVTTKILIKKKLLVTVVLLLAVSIVAAFLWNASYKNIYHMLIVKQIHLPFVRKLLQFQIDKFNFIIGNALFQLIVLFCFTLATVVLLYMKKFYSTKYLLLSMVFLITLNLIFFDRMIILTTPLATLNSSTIHLPGLNDNYRIFSLPVNLGISKNELPGKDFFLKEGKENLEFYRSDLNIPYKVNQIAGFSSVVPNTLSHYFSSKDITGVSIMPGDYVKLSDLSVLYIVDNGEITYINNSRSRLSCASCTLSSIQYGMNSIAFTAMASSEASVINTDQYFPGWLATVNGKNVPVLKERGLFRKVIIPNGRSYVVLSYVPQLFYIGLFISIISFSIFMLLLSMKWKEDI